MKTKQLLTVVVAGLMMPGLTAKADITPEHAKQIAKSGANPKYSADVPESIKTPDTAKTESLGTLNFFDGMPDKATVKKVYDHLDLYRGVDAFLNGIPAASIYAMREGLKTVGVQPHDIGIFENLMDARQLFLSANSTTIYVSTMNKVGQYKTLRMSGILFERK